MKVFEISSTLTPEQLVYIDALYSNVFNFRRNTEYYQILRIRLCFTVPTTCSRPSTKMIAISFFHSPYTFPWPDRYSLKDEILEMGLMVAKDVYLGIRIFCPIHCVAIVARRWFLGI